jgi:hypothetical protein
MLAADRIHLTRRETQAIEKLIAEHPDAPVSLTRRDPGERGPVLVHLGDQTFEVDGNKVRKVS